MEATKAAPANATQVQPQIASARSIPSICKTESSFYQAIEGRKWLQFGTGDFQHNSGWKVHLRVNENDYPKFAMDFLQKMEQRMVDNNICVKIAGEMAMMSLSPDRCKSQQVGKLVTIYVPKEQAYLIPGIINDAERAAARNNTRSTYDQLLAKGQNPEQVMMEEIVGKRKIATLRWSSCFDGSDEALDYKERHSPAGEVIRSDPHRLAAFEVIQRAVGSGVHALEVSETPRFTQTGTSAMTEEQKARLVENSKSFAELYSAIIDIGTVKGTGREYTSKDIIRDIEGIRDGTALAIDVTRTYGLRAKVKELAEKEMIRRRFKTGEGQG